MITCTQGICKLKRILKLFSLVSPTAIYFLKNIYNITNHNNNFKLVFTLEAIGGTLVDMVKFLLKLGVGTFFIISSIH